MASPLYIERLILQEIRCFEDLDIQFNKPGESIVIIGDNGDGKSAVLRSLAIGLCDQSSAAALFRELPGEFVRRDRGKRESFVQVDLRGNGGWRYRIRTDFSGLADFERVEQSHFQVKGKGEFRQIPQDEFPWSRMFVSGYGAGIRTFGNADYSNYLPVDAVYSLFRYDAALQSPELVIRRIVDEAGKRNIKRGRRTRLKLQKALSKLLNLKGARDVELTGRGIFVRGPWGRDELAALGDGYRATTTWTLDLMSWWLLYEEELAHEFSPSDLVGIVIVDEIEQHLHPLWQRTILPQLRQLFPHIQFIVATHSPLVASSCLDVTVHRLQNAQHTMHAPYGWKAEDVYDMMGVSTSRALSFQKETISEFTRLDEKKRVKRRLSVEESAKLRKLRAELKQLPPNDPTRLAIELNNMIQSMKKDSRRAKYHANSEADMPNEE